MEPASAPGRADAVLALGCAGVSLGAYAATLCPTVGLGDSGELTLAALRLGVCHPPGYPLFTWLGRIACLAPAGEPGLLTNALTALMGSAAAGFLSLAARAAGLSRLGSAVAGLTLAFSSTFWTSATSHEAYAPGLLFLSLTLWLTLRADAEHPRRTLLAAFVFGLGTSHQPTALLWLPAFVVIWPGLGNRPSRLLLPAALLLGLGFSASLGTLLRAAAGPDINWGDPSTLSRFWQHVTAHQYRALALGVPASTFWTRLAGLPAHWARDTSYPVLALAALGLVGTVVRNRRFLVSSLLLAATALFGISYNIPDYQFHLLPSVAALALLAGAGTELTQAGIRLVSRKHAASAWPRTIAALLPLLLLAAPGGLLLRGLHTNRENRTTVVRDFGANLLRSLPEDAVIMTSADVTANSMRYVQTTQGLRQDVVVLMHGMLFSRWYHEQVAQTVDLPSYNAMLEASGAGSRTMRLQRLVAQAVEAVSPARPVFLSTEMMTPEFFAGPVPKRWRVVPLGIVNRLALRSDSVSPEAVLETNRAVWLTYELASTLRTYYSPELQNVQLFYAASRSNLGMFCLEQGWREAALQNLEAALKLPAPGGFAEVVRQNIVRAQSRPN